MPANSYRQLQVSMIKRLLQCRLCAQPSPTVWLNWYKQFGFAYSCLQHLILVGWQGLWNYVRLEPWVCYWINYQTWCLLNQAILKPIDTLQSELRDGSLFQATGFMNTDQAAGPENMKPVVRGQRCNLRFSEEEKREGNRCSKYAPC